MGRAEWTDSMTRKLLIILNEEKDAGAKQFYWVNIANKFNNLAATNLNARQLKDHYGDMKVKYKTWKEFQSMTGISYNYMTNEVDVEEKSMERYKAFLEGNAKYGLRIIKRNLANTDELSKLFDGKRTSYLTSHRKVAIEGYGDNEDGVNSTTNILSGDASKAPSTSVSRNVYANSSRKRKSEDIINPTADVIQRARMVVALYVLRRLLEPSESESESKSD